MSTLALKRRRDIVRQKWQYLAVLLAVLLGVAMFVGAFSAYLNLGSSLEGTYERLAMADNTVTGASEGFVDTVPEVAGVDTAIDRRQVDVPFEIGDYTFLGRVVGMPADGQPAVNRIDVLEGDYLDPSDPSRIVLESHAANDFDLEVGDTFLIAGTEVTLAGIAVSPEYLWPARDSQNLFTAPKSFGVAFVAEGLLADLATPAVVEQVLVRYESNVDTAEVDAAIETAALAAGATAVQPLADHPSNHAINLEIDGLRTIAVALPVLFLAAAGLAIYVVVTRLVFSQRGVIGTLRATGFTRRAMSRHYRLFGVTVGVVGALLGSVLGALMGRGMTAIYTRVFGIPDLVAEFRLTTYLVALAFGIAAGLIASEPPARTVARMPPAEAMRGETPETGAKQSIFERLCPPLRRAPVRWRMSLRGIGRNRKRSWSMVVGVVLGMTLILASWGLIDTMLLAIDRQFNDVAIEDATVAFAEPVDDEQVAAVAGVDGVAAAEGVVGLEATVASGSERLATRLEAFESGTEVHGFDPPLPPDGALLGQAMQDELEVGEGDAIDVDLPTLDTVISTSVAGFVDEPLGTLAYLDVDHLRDLLATADPAVDTAVLAEPSFTTVRAVFADGADRAAVLDRIEELPGVAAVVDANQLRTLVEDFQLFFYVMVGMMVLFGGAMAFALIFNIISVNVAERSYEFASMRANGLTHRRIASLIVGETGLLVAMGIVPGLLVGYLAAVAFMSSFSSPEFPITTQIRPLSYLGAIVAMIVVVALSLIPALRAVKRIDVGQIVRERAA